MILAPDELTELQTEVAEVLDEVYPDRFNSFRGETRQRNPLAPDQFETVPNQILTNQPCSYRLTNSNERFLAGLDSSVGLYTVKTAAAINLKQGDSLTILAKGNAPAFNLTVKTILIKSNSLIWKAICVTK